MKKKTIKNYIMLQTDQFNSKRYIRIGRKYDQEDGVFKEGICHNLKKDDIDYLEQIHGLESICKKVLRAFEDLYRTNLSDIEIVTEYTARELNASYYGDRKRVIIDPYLFDALHEFFIVCFLWEDFMYQYEQVNDGMRVEDCDMQNHFFKYFLSIFHAVIEFDTHSDIYKFKYVMQKYREIGKNPLFNLIVACQYSSIYFCIAHEYAHAYFDLTNRQFYSDEYFTGDEYEEMEADKLACNLLIEMINKEEKSNTQIEERELFNYSYKSPLMLMEFYLAYFTVKEKMLSEDFTKQKKFTNERQSKLERYINSISRKEFLFDTQVGDFTYDGFFNAVSEFHNMLMNYDAQGKLLEIFDFLKKVAK